MSPTQNPEPAEPAGRTPDPPDLHRSAAGVAIGDGQRDLAQRRIDRLTESTEIVIRAQGLPRLKNMLGRERPFFLTVTDGVKKKKTQVTRRKEQYVTWTFMLSGFDLESASDITIHISAKRLLRKSKLLGTVKCPLGLILASAQQNTNFNPTTYETTLDTSIRLSILVLSSLLALEPPPAAVVDLVSMPSPGLDVGAHAASTVSGALSVLSGSDPMAAAEAVLTTADQKVEHMHIPSKHIITGVEAVSKAPEAVDKVINVYDTWKSTMERFQWFLNVVDDIAEIHPYVKTAWKLLALVPKAFLKQIEQDQDIHDLLSTMQDTLELLKEAKKIMQEPESHQAKTLITMVKLIQSGGEFVQHYAAEPSFVKRTWSNCYGSSDAEIKRFTKALADLKESFLAHATLQTQDNTLFVIELIDRMSDQLKDVAKMMMSEGQSIFSCIQSGIN
ncbi:hypothetical protein FA95DRAFT_1152439 [Auriscalpium vulgare]|uniref:Uncharacterized protein n=1 Tax=Auriscalpium vulgare TaxID=40419 RepID=A0ACB8RU83_9AGAM|nr:hypothetical protein FA95DRAFT_1152439 [Auriscalpium vulgare]